MILANWTINILIITTFILYKYIDMHFIGHSMDDIRQMTFIIFLLLVLTKICVKTLPIVFKVVDKMNEKRKVKQKDNFL